VTVTADKRKYGVMLRAEPDHKVLGARLKAAFKTVLAAIKNLTDEELTTFQQSGEMVVGGHRLGPDDLRLIYTFDQTSDDTPNHYDAYSDNNVRRELGLILSITTGQSNLSEIASQPHMDGSVVFARWHQVHQRWNRVRIFDR